MSDNLSETDLNKAFYPSSTDADLNETTEELEDETTVDNDEESEEGEEGNEEASETFEFNGQEINTDTLTEWELAFNNRKHQQADYTKKGQAAADKMKSATAEFDKFQGLNESLQDSVNAMDLMLNEEENSVNWDELSEDDPGEALKLERKFKKKRKELDAAKSKLTQAKKQASDAKILDEGNKLVELIPDWFDAKGQTSKQYKDDTDSILEYLGEHDYPKDYANQITTAKEWDLLRNASKYHALQKKKPGIKKKVTKLKTANAKAKPKSSKSFNQMSSKEANSLFYG